MLGLLFCSEDGGSRFLRNVGKYLSGYAGFEVLTEVVMKSSVFWDVKPYSPLKVNGRFERTCCLQLQVED
jgi:hypothetical protein